MNEDMIKGFMLGGLNNFHLHDKDGFIQKTEYSLGAIVEEKDIEALLDEMIEEGWIKYYEEGNSIQTSTPEGVST